jgi:phosphotransferase system enzyme I (PtsI)
MKIERGIAVSPGVTIASAYLIEEVFIGPDRTLHDESEVTAELLRFEQACDRTVADLEALHDKVLEQLGPDQAAIFRAHELIVRDRAFRSKVRNRIAEQRLTAPAALVAALEEYSELFRQTNDAYLRERVSDLQDVSQRISGYLSDALRSDSKMLPGPVIVVANELLPSHVLALGDRQVAGLVTQSGGKTSHAAILARSRGIPAVTGIPNVRHKIKNGETIVLDGRTGNVVIAPDEATLENYRKLYAEYLRLKRQLAVHHDRPCVSGDGEPVEILANVNTPEEARRAAELGAVGVGLYRTEYLFLSHPGIPDEDEQYEVYRQVIEASPNRRVTLRTLDLGGDKTTPYLGRGPGNHREDNPFMGWRSLRISFEHPDFFLRQIRATLRAASEFPDARVQMLFPMISTLEEVRKARSLVAKARRQMEARGVHAPHVAIGMMIEVPAAAILTRTLVRECDYASIGSNDLVQYLMAADRDNPKVAHLCQPLSPAVLRVLQRVITSCRTANKPVTLCGEMAGSPRAVILLYAMGLRSLSMSPSFIPPIKRLVSQLRNDDVRKVLKSILRLKTNRQIARLMNETMDEICPDLKLLDT